jgi:MFS family permease
MTTPTNPYRRNLYIYPFFIFFSQMLIIGPILVPFMRFKGLDYSEILLLQSISAISVFAFEVPTGVIADLVSRRVSLILSGLFMASGLLFYLLFSTFFHFICAEILFGIGLTFSSGADSALLFETLKLERKESELQKREGTAMSFVFIGQAIGSVISGWLYRSDPYSPMWISFANVLIAMFSAFFFREVPREKSGQKYYKHVGASFALTFKTPALLWIVVLASLFGFASRISYWMYEPFFSCIHLDIRWYGIVFLFFNLTAAFSSRVLVSKASRYKPRKVLLFLSYLLSITFILPVLSRNYFGIVFLNFQQVVRGMHKPVTQFYINKHIEDKYRATILSTVGLASNLSFAILSPFIGVSLDRSGAAPTYSLIFGVVFVWSVFLTVLRLYQKKRKQY